MFKIEYDGKFYSIYKKVERKVLFLSWYDWEYCCLTTDKDEAYRLLEQLKEYPKYVS